jgi:septin family protein
MTKSLRLTIDDKVPGPQHTQNTTLTTGPTVRLSSQVLSASVDQFEPVQLRLIDTPGLNLSDDPIGSKARERGVAGLIRLLEERFEETLKEESRIIRTRKRQEDGMIHLGKSAALFTTQSKADSSALLD